MFIRQQREGRKVNRVKEGGKEIYKGEREREVRLIV